VRRRHALSLLALALPLPVVVSGVPHPATGARALSEPAQVRPEPTTSPAWDQRGPRPAPRRVASRSRRVVVPQQRAAATHPHSVRRAAVPHATRHVVTGYPWASDTTGGHDTWGFTMRQCVSYVAWRLSRVGRPVYARQGWGSASGWDDVARRRGVTGTTRPAVGSVAQWNAGESSRVPRGTFTAGSYGHVAWVTAVYSDGSVQVAQYNGTGTRTYSSMRVFAPRFLRL
jgi:surface antigen